MDTALERPWSEHIYLNICSGYNDADGNDADNNNADNDEYDVYGAGNYDVYYDDADADDGDDGDGDDGDGDDDDGDDRVHLMGGAWCAVCRRVSGRRRIRAA